MTGQKLTNQKKNLLYCTERDHSQLVEGARIHTWERPMIWNCSAKTRRVATVRSGMQLSYCLNGDYQLSYLQDLDPQLQRMRWMCLISGLDAEKNELFDFFVDTRELTVHPVTKSWAYQIHYGSENVIARHFDEIAFWKRDLIGNGWFKEP